MAIDIDLLKFYAPIETNPATVNYGQEPSTVEMTSGVLGNEFDNVTNTERESGLVDYRKQFLKNGNADTWEGVTVWIASNTPCEDDTIEICGAGVLSMVGESSLVDTASYITATIVAIPDTSLWNSVAPGEHVYDDDNDSSMANSRQVLSVVTDATGQYLITMAASFGGATDSTFTLGVTPATMFTYIEAASKASGIVVGDIPGGEYSGVWKRRTVTAGAKGYSNNTVTLRWESE